MKVKLKQMNPDLKVTGAVVRMILPCFTKKTFRFCRKLTKVMIGRCKSDLCYEQVEISREDGSNLRLCVYSPREVKKNVPGLLWMHGGGYGLGVPEQDEAYIDRFIQASGCVVVAPDYRLSIDAPYPAALHDCYAALLWLKKHGHAYGMREDQIMIGGESAGGGLTAALSLYARDKREVAIAFQMPLYPMIDDRMGLPSAMSNDAPIWNSRSNYNAWKLYLGDKFMSEDAPIYAAPARAADLSGVPPTCTFVGDLEPFHDETVRYIQQLKSCGIPTHFRIFKGCWHAFDVLCPKSSCAKDATAFLMESFLFAVDNYQTKNL